MISRRAFNSLAGATALAGLPAGPVAAQVSDDPLRYVAAEYKPFFPLLRQIMAIPPMSQATLAERRKPNPQFNPAPAPTPTISERVIPGARGAPPVRLYVVNAGGSGKPAILHIHGGGFVAGTAKEGLRMLQDFASSLDCVIVSVDYRLAPETRFPGALEDNYAGLLWLYQNAASLGADRTRIAVMGESAGGGHAAMLAIAARDRGQVPVIFQALTYPMLDDRTGSTRHVPPHIGAIGWGAADNRFGWTSYLGVPAGSPQAPPGSVPARVEDLTRLPPAFIGVGAIDLFVDEDVEYARRLIQAGVPTELHVYPGAFHGFNVLPTESGRHYTAALKAALAQAFASGKRVSS